VNQVLLQTMVGPLDIHKSFGKLPPW